MNLLVQPGLGRLRSSGKFERGTHRTLLVLFALLWLAMLAMQFPSASPVVTVNWVEPTFLVAALLATVSSLTRRIPLQNALMAATAIALLGGAAHWISFATGIPFGPIEFTQAEERTPFQEWFCVPAIIWVVMLLNARELALLILLGWPRLRNRGLYVIGLAALLVVGMALMLEPFASRAHHYWLWGETRLPVTWFGAPLSAFMGWAVASVIGSIAATAALIDKHPRPAPPSIEAAWIWAMLCGLLGVGNAAAGLWTPAGVSAAGMVLALVAIVTECKRRRATQLKSL